MKNNLNFRIFLKFTLVFSLIAFAPQQVEAQFLKKLKEKAEKKVEREAEKRAERRMNKKIDEGLDKAEDAIDGKEKKDKKKDDKSKDSDKKKQDEKDKASTEKKPNISWSRFDFVPGDTVLFEDGPSINEDNGEFPSRWDIVKGNCEIINVDGENVIAFPKGGSIIPYLKDSNNDYLPEVFTIELDAWFYTDTNQCNLYVYFYDKKNQRSNGNYKAVEVNSFSAEYDASYQEVSRDKHNGMWRHISIAYTKGKLKVYLDETRLINIPVWKEIHQVSL